MTTTAYRHFKKSSGVFLRNVALLSRLKRTTTFPYRSRALISSGYGMMNTRSDEEKSRMIHILSLFNPEPQVQLKTLRFPLHRS